MKLKKWSSSTRIHSIKITDTSNILPLKSKRKNRFKLFQPKSNIYEVILPFFYLLKCVGYGCFSIKGNAVDGEIYTTPCEFMIFAFFVSFNILLLYMSLVMKTTFAESVILDFGAKIVLWTAITIAGISEIITFIFRKQTWTIVRKLYRFDNLVSLVVVLMHLFLIHKNMFFFIFLNTIQ